MSSWHALQEELQRLETLSPIPLRSYPSLDSARSPRGPVEIDLAAQAAAVAAELHARFGDMVRLRVGLLACPESRAQLTRCGSSAGSGPGCAAWSQAADRLEVGHSRGTSGRGWRRKWSSRSAASSAGWVLATR